MDVALLSRLQFAFTIMFHYIFPPLTIGLGVILAYLETRFHVTKKPVFAIASQFWTKIFVLNFAIGVSTGIVMEFQFGTNWAAYASIFSAFYIPFVLLLFALIFRTVSLEFRSKRKSPFWRNFWDILFFVGSTLAAFLFGVAIGAVMQGLELSELGDYQGTMVDMLSGFSISVGLFTVALLAMHGAIYLYLKTEGELQQRLLTWMKGTYYLYLALFVVVSGRRRHY